MEFQNRPLPEFDYDGGPVRGPSLPALGAVEPGVQASQEKGFPTLLGDF